MDFVKRNPILTTILVLCVALFAAESYFLTMFSGKVSVAQRALNEARSRAGDAERITPAPTAANRDAAQQNAEELKATLTKVKSTFQDTPIKITNIPTAGPELLVGIQGYMTKMHDSAVQHGIILPDDKATFGMAMYIGHVSAPPVEKIPAVFKQMTILDYLLTHLFEEAKQPNQEMKLVSVRRENVAEVPRYVSGVLLPSADSGDDEHNELFKIDPAITARVPGAVDTLAFQISFISYTESLRALIEVLKRFDLPLVVRSIQVEPATLADLAGTVEGAPPPKGAAARAAALSETAKPVVTENLSKFTLVLEYIELPGQAVAAPDAAAGTAAPAAASATGTAN